MSKHEPTRANVPDVSKSITVPVPVDEAFRIFVEWPIEWLPAGHTFLKDPSSITLEPTVGGSFREHGADGAEAVRGTVVEWAPPNRLVLTWRIGANWQPVFDDERASLIEVDFHPAGPGATEVVTTNTHLHRHGHIAELIRAALDGPSPGDTLTKYAEVVTRHTTATRG